MLVLRVWLLIILQLLSVMAVQWVLQVCFRKHEEGPVSWNGDLLVSSCKDRCSVNSVGLGTRGWKYWKVRYASASHMLMSVAKL